MIIDSRILGRCHLFKSKNSFFFLQEDTGATLLTSIDIGKYIIEDRQIPELLRVLHNRGFLIDGTTKRNNTSKIISPTFFMVDLTNSCSNCCSYCFRKTHHNVYIKDNMLNNIVAKIIEHCQEHSIKQISLQAWGGEPLLAWNAICKMQDMLKNAKIDVRLLIETNGVSVSDKIAKQMYERNILCSVSIDGPSYIHNRNRLLINGKGSHAAAIRGFDLLRSAGYGQNIGIVCVITHDSLNHISEIVDYFANELKLSRVKMNIIKDSDELQNKSLCLSNEEISSFWRHLLDKIISTNKRGIPFGENTIIAMLHNLTTHRPTSFCHSRGCQAGYRMLSFGIDGGIYPCDLTDHAELKLGDIYSKKSLNATISSQVFSNPLLKLQRPYRCNDCSWQAFCDGGCKTMRLFNLNNEFDQADCIRNQTLYPLLIELIMNDPEIIKTITGGEIIIK